MDWLDWLLDIWQWKRLTDGLIALAIVGQFWVGYRLYAFQRLITVHALRPVLELTVSCQGSAERPHLSKLVATLRSPNVSAQLVSIRIRGTLSRLAPRRQVPFDEVFDEVAGEILAANRSRLLTRELDFAAGNEVEYTADVRYKDIAALKEYPQRFSSR